MLNVRVVEGLSSGDDREVVGRARELRLAQLTSDVIHTIKGNLMLVDFVTTRDVRLAIIDTMNVGRAHYIAKHSSKMIVQQLVEAGVLVNVLVNVSGTAHGWTLDELTADAWLAAAGLIRDGEG